MQGRTVTNQYFLLVIASTFLQGSSFVSTKIVMEDMSPLWTASTRFLIAALSLTPFIFLQVRQERFSLSELSWIKLLVIGTLQTTGVMALLNIGLTATTPSKAAIIMASNPLLVVVFSRFILGEKASWPALGGLTLAFFGVIICIGLTLSGTDSIGYGDVLVLLASTCWACSTVLNKKFDISVSPWIVTFWQMLLGSLLLIVVAALSKQSFSLPSNSYHWIMFFWLAIPASTGAIGLWFAALKIGGSVQTSGFLFLCPLFSALVTFILTGQHPEWNEIAGGTLVGAGLYVMSRQNGVNRTSLPIR
ncbi:DMT family transporter [Zobellella sp. DQSA1]|uniref:DMT family transporter n=1 Tax=Zobellella sp. DQSA1 TaxID=3342386 RepID=UPI0035C001B5